MTRLPNFNDITRMPTFGTDSLLQKALQDIVSQVPPIDDTRYGEPQEIGMKGRMVTVHYGDQQVQYLVPSSQAWTAGTGKISIGKAFRVCNPGEETECLREVRDPQELESAASGYIQMIRDTLDRTKKS
jgi:hypothetical protein